MRTAMKRLNTRKYIMGFCRGSRTRILLLILLFSSQIYFTVGFCDTSSNSVEHVILIILDCIRPSVLQTTSTPNMDLLMETGSYTYEASSVTPSNTISAIPAILTGAPPEIHQFTSWDSSLNAESIIEVLEENGYPSAIIGEGSNLGGYSATYCTGFENRVDFDDYYFSVALEWFTEYRPFLTFIYDPVPDDVGHQYGHESVEYREAIEKADYQIGRVLTLLRELDVFDSSLIVITTDHGLAGTSHNRQCFSIWRGPGIKKGYEIDGKSKYILTYGWVSHEIVDIAPTILEYLGLRPLSDATGEVISAIFEPVSEPPLRPAEFVASNLSITPEEPGIWEEVDISFTVTNIGELPGDYAFTLGIKGPLIVVSREINGSLEAGESERASYKLGTNVPGTYSVELDGLKGSFTMKASKPAEFEVSDLTITPADIELGEEVTVSFFIINVDSRYHIFMPFVQIGDAMIMEGVELEGHESRTVSYTMKPESVGDYEVEVDGLTGRFTVKPEPSFWDKIPGFPYESITLGLIAVIIILWYARARYL